MSASLSASIPVPSSLFCLPPLQIMCYQRGGGVGVKKLCAGKTFMPSKLWTEQIPLGQTFINIK